MVLFGLALAAGCSGNRCGPRQTPVPSGLAAGTTVSQPIAGGTASAAVTPEAGATAHALTGSSATPVIPVIERPFAPAVIMDSDTATLPDLTPYKLVGEQRARDLIGRGEGVQPPLAPSEFKAAPGDNFGVILSWIDQAGDEIFYQVDRAGPDQVFESAALLGANASGMADGPLLPGTYWYRARAVSASGASPYAGPVSVTVASPEERPLLPEELAAEAYPSLKVRLSWTVRSADVSWFRVERALGSEDFKSLGVVGPDRRWFVDERVEPDNNYAYQVTAVNPAGESESSEIVWALVLKEESAPGPPYELLGRAVDPYSASLLWKDGSDNEDRFIVERKIRDQDKYVAVMELDRDETKAVVRGLAPGEMVTLRVRAANAAGWSAASGEVSVVPFGQAVASYVMKIDPAGQVTVTGPADPNLPALAVWNTLPDGEGFSADIALVNRDPDHRLENAYVLVEETDRRGIFMPDCDRGPAGCSLDEAKDGGDPVGYQYVEGGYLGQAPFGAEMEHHRIKDRHYPVRDVHPACGQVKVRWRLHGVTGPAKLTLNLYADVVPADFRDDPRHDPNRATWIVEPYSIGLSDGAHEPGAASNPTARPLNRLKPGEVFAVNVALEAADWMELQSQWARVQDEPGAFYDYWSGLAFALNYDPAVIRPIASRMVMPDGSVLLPGLRDPLVGDRPLADGWSIRTGAGGVSFYPDDGWVQALFYYPPFEFRAGEGKGKICVHCGQEGFVDSNGVTQGPDPQAEVLLGLFYFQVTGPPGSGTAIRLAPRPDTYIGMKSAGGTLSNQGDDREVDPWKDVNPLLPATAMLPGEYQVRESYLCVEQPISGRGEAR